MRWKWVTSATLLAAVLMGEDTRPATPAASGNAASISSVPGPGQSSELGLIWLTDLQAAKPQAKAQGKSILLFKNLTVDEFAQMTANKTNVILDVRTVKEFESGHLPGALNLDVTGADFAGKAAALDKRKTYLVHCASGVRSVRACEALGRLGFLQLYNLPGGFRAWAKAGKPVEK